MSRVKFSFEKDYLKYELVQKYYTTTNLSLERHYSKRGNPEYLVDFFGKNEDIVNKEKVEHQKELSREATFVLLASIEAMFREDFIIRCQANLTDSISSRFLAEYNPVKKIYHYKFKELILNTWKENKPEYASLLDQLSQAFDYRNWIGHGRYWQFKDNESKFTFEKVFCLAQMINVAFVSSLYKSEMINSKNKLIKKYDIQ
ncbi:MAG: hypothetical protein KBS70_00905 [Bacteroidales bacterium]|nr:hypothetical protein [Candidatus Colicola equi]